MDVKLFNKWDCASVIIKDVGLRSYINLPNKALPYSFGLGATRKFGKSKIHLVERLVNNLMVTGHIKDTRVHKRISGRDSGKKQRTYKSIESAFDLIEKRTKQNPVQVLVQAIENAAPREETTRIRQGGIIVHKAVDVAPARRLDIALKFVTHGAAQRSFSKKATLESALAEEIIAASNYDNKCYSIGKRDELERVAQSAR
ncbi:MAG: 30S ribosomal protein S7 [archaeon]